MEAERASGRDRSRERDRSRDRERGDKEEDRHRDRNRDRDDAKRSDRHHHHRDHERKRDDSRERDNSRDRDRDRDRDRHRHRSSRHKDDDDDRAHKFSSHRHHRSERHHGSRSASPSSSRRHRSKDRKGDSDRHRRHRHGHRRKHRSRSRSLPPVPANILLPENAKPIPEDTGLYTYFKMFVKYLDIQKNLDVGEMSEKEAVSRFKKFANRWNRGELASGWYGASMKQQTDLDDSYPTWEEYIDYINESKASEPKDKYGRDVARRSSPSYGDERKRGKLGGAAVEKRDAAWVHGLDDAQLEAELARLEGRAAEGREGDVRMRDGSNDGGDSDDDGSSSDDDAIGPTLPGAYDRRVAGAAVPTRQDLDLQDEMNAEEARLRYEDLRYERKKERKNEKERLDELVPKAEAGTRERQLEKRRETAAANRSFADAKASGGDMMDVGEDVLMGGSDTLKERKLLMERKKNERELRREALLRARKAEREERLKVHKAKEDNTMRMLKALAEKYR